MPNIILRDLRKALAAVGSVLVVGARETLKPVTLSAGTVLGWRVGEDAPSAVTVAQQKLDLALPEFTEENQIIVSASAEVSSAISIPEGTLVGRRMGLNVGPVTPSQALTILGLSPIAAGDVFVGSGVGTYERVAVGPGELLGRSVGGDPVAGLPGGSIWSILNGSPTKRQVSIIAVAGEASYSVTDSDEYLIVTPNAGGTAINLPPAATSTGRRITVKDNGGAAANNITIDGDNAETIDGAATLVLSTDYDRATLVCNGAAWFRVA